MSTEVMSALLSTESFDEKVLIVIAKNTPCS